MGGSLYDYPPTTVEVNSTDNSRKYNVISVKKLYGQAVVTFTSASDAQRFHTDFKIVTKQRYKYEMTYNNNESNVIKALGLEDIYWGKTTNKTFKFTAPAASKNTPPTPTNSKNTPIQSPSTDNITKIMKNEYGGLVLTFDTKEAVTAFHKKYSIQGGEQVENKVSYGSRNTPIIVAKLGINGAFNTAKNNTEIVVQSISPSSSKNEPVISSHHTFDHNPNRNTPAVVPSPNEKKLPNKVDDARLPIQETGINGAANPNEKKKTPSDPTHSPWAVNKAVPFPATYWSPEELEEARRKFFQEKQKENKESTNANATVTPSTGTVELAIKAQPKEPEKKEENPPKNPNVTAVINNTKASEGSEYRKDVVFKREQILPGTKGR